jgi:hypothetical protein
VNGDIFEVLGGIAEALGFGDGAKSALRGPAAYASGRSMQSDAGDGADAPFAYERVLTRPRDPRINDR